MKHPVETLGKVGDLVYGKNRFGQTCYARVIPANPRTQAQQTNRHLFGSLAPRWSHRLTEANRLLFELDARHYRTHGRPGQSARLTGFLRYMQFNMLRLRQGLPPLDVPPSAFSLQPLAFPHALPPRRLHPVASLRVPVGRRSATVATRFRAAWSPLESHRAPFGPRAGPGPPPAAPLGAQILDSQLTA